MPKVNVVIVARNAMKFLPETLKSVFVQTGDFSVMVMDNASNDGTDRFVRESYPQATVIRSVRDAGTARARNQAISYLRAHLAPGEGAAVLMLAPDTVLEPDFIRLAGAELDRRPSVGSVGGLVLRAHVGEEDGLPQSFRTEAVETAGLGLRPDGRVAERDFQGGAGGPEEVFGVSGTASVFRLTALESVAYRDGSVYDGELAGEGKDRDLAWRLRLAGWQSVLLPSARAYRFRSVREIEARGIMDRVRLRRRRPAGERRAEEANRILLIVKNAHAANLFRHFLRLFAYGFRRFFYRAFFEPDTLFFGLGVMARLPAVLARRREAKALSLGTASAEDIRRWAFGQKR